MKKSLLLIIYLLIATVTFSQTEKSNRSSLSIILLDYKDQYSVPIRDLFDRVMLNARYDINDISIKRITVNEKRSQPNSNGNYYAPDRTNQILTFLNKENVGQEIIRYLFDRNKQTGEMSLDRIYARGLYNVSDQNIIDGNATKRGIEGLKDSGFSLIENCHLMIFDYANIRYEYKNSKDGKNDYYWYSTPAAYLFKIEWSEKLQQKLFDCWIDKDTPYAERSDRKQAFNRLTVPVKFITRKANDSRSESTGIEEQQRKVNNGEKRKYRNDELKTNSFNKMIYEAADYLGEEIEGKYESFQIQNSLYGTHPLKAKIGRKEGIGVNDRYFVYEHVAKDENTIKEVRKGVIRATSHIAENRNIASGDSPTTEFYQIAGGKLEEGMTIREKQSYYINLDMGYRYGELEGVYAGLSTGLYATRATNHYMMLGVTGWKKAVTVSLNYGFGLRCNNFEIYPYIGAGLDSFLKDKDESDSDSSKSSAWLAQGGIRFNLNIYYPLQLFGAVEYDFLLKEDDNYLIKKVLKDRDIEGFNLYGGLRVCF